MSIAKAKRENRRQLGQFLTPAKTAARLVDDLSLGGSEKVLEPSFGDGSFLLAVIEASVAARREATNRSLGQVLTENVYGVEIDPILYEKCLNTIEERWGPLPDEHNLVCGDFFKEDFALVTAGLGAGGLFGEGGFDVVVGNPPFGGTFDPVIEDKLDRAYGRRNGEKIKKETYSFFLLRCVEMLRPEGRLRFICSDTLMTIKTMRGLRRYLMDTGTVILEDLDHFSEETNQPMVVLNFVRNGASDSLRYNSEEMPRALMDLTGNFSWGMSNEFAPYFAGPTVGDYLIASGGMTTGNNELFVRDILDDHTVLERYRFEYYQKPITLEEEISKARLNQMSPRMMDKFRAQERRGETYRAIRAVAVEKPVRVELPHPDYRYYNKASSGIVYTAPRHAIYWRDEGDAVLTYKKTGNWYLHGVGGMPFFGREGLSWQLVAPKLNVRYLPPGYILDSGAPCAFLRDGVEHDELYFILGWVLTDAATRIMKQVINHTRNIQGKDFEKLPYPHWVPAGAKAVIIADVKAMIESAMDGRVFKRTDAGVTRLNQVFQMPTRD